MISRERSNGSGCLLVIGHHSQLENGLGFELTDPLTRDIDLTTDFRQGEWLSAIQAETQFEDFLFPLIELREPASEVFLLECFDPSLPWVPPRWGLESIRRGCCDLLRHAHGHRVRRRAHSEQ